MAELRQPPRIEAWGAGGFRIGGERFEGAVLLVGDLAQAWAPTSLGDITPAALAPVLALGRAGVEFLVLGCGEAPRPAPRPVREALAAAGLGLEVMSTAEACRLYNALIPDGRRLAAALLPV